MSKEVEMDLKRRVGLGYGFFAPDSSKTVGAALADARKDADEIGRNKVAAAVGHVGDAQCYVGGTINTPPPPLSEGEHQIGNNNISLLTRDGSGSSITQPMAIEYKDNMAPPLQETPPQPLSEGDLSIKIKANKPWLLDVPQWLTYAPGDIFHTDGIIKAVTFNVFDPDLPDFYNFHSGIEYPAYTARNDAGQIGFVHQEYFSYCHS